MTRTYSVQSVSYSLSSEGKPSQFIRFAGCNLAEEGHPCSWCNAPEAQLTEQGKQLNTVQITGKLQKNPCMDVMLTGGEPLHRKGLFTLSSHLKQLGYKVCVDTNGSLGVNFVVRYVMDVKCPSSGNAEYNLYSNLPNLKFDDTVKFVVRDREDFEFALEVLGKYTTRATPTFSPVGGELSVEEVGEWLMSDYPEGRVV